jgi:hypothetical protein
MFALAYEAQEGNPMPKADRRYVLYLNGSEVPIAHNLDLELTQSLQSELRAAGVKAYLARWDLPDVLPVSKSDQQRRLRLIESIFCIDCHHSANVHPAKGYHETGACLTCYRRDIYVHDDGSEHEMPLCTKSLHDVLIDHLLSDGEPKVYVAGVDAGRAWYTSANGGFCPTPIPLFDRDEAEVVARHASLRTKSEIRVFEAPLQAAQGSVSCNVCGCTEVSEATRIANGTLLRCADARCGALYSVADSELKLTSVALPANSSEMDPF